jgi:Zn-dependent protease with chaperone function
MASIRSASRRCEGWAAVSSASRLYRLQLAVAAIVSAAVVLTTALAITRLDLRLPSQAAIVSACRQVIPVRSGLAMLAVLALLALGLVVVVLAARSVVLQVARERRFRARLPRPDELDLGGEHVLVVPGRESHAFCAGILRPRIYVTEGAVSTLTARELHAVIAHESHHRRRHDPLRILTARVLADGLFFVPGLRRLADRYRELAELAADERAAAVVGREPLASALLAFGPIGNDPATVVGVAPERVDHLLGEKPRWHVSARVSGGALGSAIALAVAGIMLPALIGGGTLSLSLLVAEACTVGMVALPLAALAAALAAFKKPSRSAA